MLAESEVPLRIYVVNLDRSKDRWEKISAQLDMLGLPYERFAAVDGARLDDYTEGFHLSRFRIVSGHDLVPGEAGCSRSHIEIWKAIVRDRLNYAVVLEDDVVIRPEFVDFLKSQAYQGFDYLKLDVNEDTYPYESEVIRAASVGGFKLTECDPVPYCTGAYVISLKGAGIFLRASRKMYVPIDILPQYTFPYTVQGYATPQLAWQEEEESTIDGRSFANLPRMMIFRDFFIKLMSRFFLRKIAVKVAKFRYRF